MLVIRKTLCQKLFDFLNWRCGCAHAGSDVRLEGTFEGGGRPVVLFTPYMADGLSRPSGAATEVTWAHMRDAHAF